MEEVTRFRDRYTDTLTACSPLVPFPFSFFGEEEGVFRTVHEPTVVDSYLHSEFMDVEDSRVERCTARAYVPLSHPSAPSSHRHIPLLPGDVYPGSYQSATTQDTSLRPDVVVGLVKDTLAVFEMPYRYTAAKLKVTSQEFPHKDPVFPSCLTTVSPFPVRGHVSWQFKVVAYFAVGFARMTIRLWSRRSGGLAVEVTRDRVCATAGCRADSTAEDPLSTSRAAVWD